TWTTRTTQLPRSAKHRRPWYKSWYPQRSKRPKQRETSARRQAQRRLRRKQRVDAVKNALKKGGAGALILALIAGLAGGVILVVRDEEAPPPGTKPPREAAIEDTIDTTLVFGTKEKTPDEDAVWLALLSRDASSGRSSVLYIPAHTATEVPGRGLLGVGEAVASGGVALLLVTTENLLGVQIDRYVELSDSDALVLFEKTGPLVVDVPLEVSIPVGENETRLLFEEGEQLLPAKFLKQLLFTVGAEGDEAELGSRHLAFWNAVFTEFGDNPGALGRAIEESSSALAESDADADELADFFERLVSARPNERVLATLPVTQVSVGGDELYDIDTDDLPEFMEETLGSRPSLGQEIRVQILNGNGVPGIGEEVAEKLSEENFRVLLSGNARSLDYEKTLIVTYDASEKGIAVAERAKELLGVGEVQVSAQGQGIVDLTIVVGKDFVEAD
ncbi:MAG: LCP family protein, partial [Actinomycetota bacterium]|nr:LCP family protein [Actinomycetota bacterium]